MPSKRLELTVAEELWDQMESARGDVPRARWVKLALEAFLVPSKPSSPSKPSFASRYPADGDKPRTESLHEVQRPQFVRARSLITPEVQSEWAEIMAARQARLNRKRDGAA